MSKTSARGRVAPKRNNSAKTIYIILALVAVAAVGALTYFALNPQRPTSTTSTGTSTAKGTGQPLDINSFQALGSPDAPVTVIEYADFQCPACGYFATALKQQFVTDYVDTGKVRFIYHEYPLPMHRNSVPAGEAGRCAAEQGKFWEMHDEIFKRQTEWERLPNPAPAFASYAVGVGLDSNAFNTCLTSRRHQATVEQAGIDADAAGIRSTPTFVVNGKQFEARDLRSGIDAALAAAGR